MGELRPTMPAQTVRPDIPVLLLSWNTQAFTLLCIDSIADGLDDDTRVQEVVVENGSREALEARDDIEVIVNEANRGYSAAVNQPYQLATGDLVLLLNFDIVFLPGSLSTVRRFLSERPDVARVGPLHLNPEATRQQHHFRLPRFAMALSDARRLFARIPALPRTEREYRMLDVEFTEPRRLEQPSASVLLTAGHELWMTPDAAVVHDTAPPGGCWAAPRPASTSARISASCSGRSRRSGSCFTAPSSSSRSSGGSSSGARARCRCTISGLRCAATQARSRTLRAGRSPGPRVLLFAYYRPPLGGAGVQRLGGTVPGLRIDTRSHLYLLRAAEAVLAARPELRPLVEVHLAGVVSAGDRAALPAGLVTAHGYLRQDATVDLLGGADLLFLPMHDLPPGTTARIAPGKTYHYLATGNPILAAVPDGDARDLLAAAGTGLLAHTSDVGALAKLIEAQIDRRQRGGPAPEADAAVASAFERRSLTRRLATVFGGALGVEPAAAPVEAREIAGAAR